MAFHESKKWREWEEMKAQVVSLFSSPLGCLGSLLI